MKKKAVANSNKVAVTFEAPANSSMQALNLVGDFNNWDQAATPMKRLKDGSWSATLRLAPGKYAYRYVTPEGSWRNDPMADGYEPSGFGEDNSVLLVENGR
jgi:1,4-alpha-glucan branching enzyme